MVTVVGPLLPPFLEMRMPATAPAATTATIMTTFLDIQRRCALPVSEVTRVTLDMETMA